MLFYEFYEFSKVKGRCTQVEKMGALLKVASAEGTLLVLSGCDRICQITARGTDWDVDDWIPRVSILLLCPGNTCCKKPCSDRRRAITS